MIPDSIDALKAFPKAVKDLQAAVDRLTVVAGHDAPLVAFAGGKTVVFPTKQDNATTPFTVGQGDTVFHFRNSQLSYPDPTTGQNQDVGLPQLSVIRSGYVYVDQPASIELPGIGRFPLKAEDSLSWERQNIGAFTITTTRQATAVKVVVSDSPQLPIELSRTVNARRIAGFDGKTLTAQSLATALTALFSPQKAFAVLDVGFKFTSTYSGIVTLTKVSRLGAAFNIRRLNQSLATAPADDFEWAPNPEWDFQKGDAVQIDLTAQAGAVVSGELVTDDR